MNALHSSLYAVALVCCLLLGLGLRGVARKMPRTNYLALLLVLQSSGFVFEWLMVNPGSPAKSLWLTLVMGISFLLAPCLWLYAREITEEQPPRMRDLPRAHFLLIAVGLVLLLPLLERTHLGTEFIHATRVTTPAHSLLIHICLLLAVLIFAVQVPWYLRACRRILAVHVTQTRALFSNLENRQLNALRLLILVVGAHWIVGIARTLHCLLFGSDAGFVVVFAFVEVAVTVWAMASFLRHTITVDPVDRRLAEELTPAKYRNSALDGPTRERIRRKLEDVMTREQAHRDNRLTLRGLCARLREKPHYVSQVISQDLDSTFYDLVNGYRIRDAMEMLLADPERSVLEIALEVGFNSKSTFNAAFREHARTTPREYRAAGVRPG